MTPRHGEIWWANLPPLEFPAAHHQGPTLIAVVQNERKQYGRTLLCVVLTSNLAHRNPYGVLVRADKRNNLKVDSIAMPWTIGAVRVRDMQNRVGALDGVYLEAIADMLNLLLTP